MSEEVEPNHKIHSDLNSKPLLELKSLENQKLH
jgi:hypothetical protein